LGVASDGAVGAVAAHVFGAGVARTVCGVAEVPGPAGHDPSAGAVGVEAGGCVAVGVAGVDGGFPACAFGAVGVAVAAGAGATGVRHLSSHPEQQRRSGTLLRGRWLRAAGDRCGSGISRR
jgi:hypothetical protein